MAERPGDAPHLLALRGLSLQFKAGGVVLPALRDVSWHVDRGETLVVLGESGSGKSMTANAIMGLVDMPPGRITSGEIALDGRDILRLTPAERRSVNGRRIAMVFQDPLASLNPVLTVGSQVAEAGRVHGQSRAAARRHAIALLDRVGIPDASRRAADYPHQFSGGQRQRIMIAIAVALRPDLLIADEPTSALDVTVQRQILDLISELQRETGMGVVLITHDLGVAAQMADRVVVMRHGRVVESGPVAEIFVAPQHEYTRELLASAPGQGAFRAPTADPEAPLLSVRGLSKVYLGRRRFFARGAHRVDALKQVDLAVSVAESVAVVGESGSGKTTLARILLGLERATAGRATLAGIDLLTPTLAARRELRRRMQVVFQDPTSSLTPWMTATELIAEPWIVHPGVVPPAEHRERAEELLVRVGLSREHADRYPYQFSGGQRQRIAIARAIALRPDLVICDEAVSALDVSVQAHIIRLLQELQREHGLAYLFIAHDLGVVRDFADRVVVMRRGEVVEAGLTERVFERPEHPYTRALIAASVISSIDHPAQERPTDAHS